MPVGETLSRSKSDPGTCLKAIWKIRAPSRRWWCLEGNSGKGILRQEEKEGDEAKSRAKIFAVSCSSEWRKKKEDRSVKANLKEFFGVYNPYLCSKKKKRMKFTEWRKTKKAQGRWWLRRSDDNLVQKRKIRTEVKRSSMKTPSGSTLSSASFTFAGLKKEEENATGKIYKEQTYSRRLERYFRPRKR